MASTILHLRAMVPDKLEVYSATKENIATPAIPYGADVLPVTIETINKLDMIQRQRGKTFLRSIRVPMSSTNEVVELELGLSLFC